VSYLGALRKPKETCTLKDDYEECRKVDVDIDEQRDQPQANVAPHRSGLAGIPNPTAPLRTTWAQQVRF
jgi:hypothetical protein